MKRWNRFFEDLFPGLGEMEREFDRIFEQARTGDTEGPLYFGYSMHQGPDGVPHVETYGNVPNMPDAETLSLHEGVREPFADVMEDGEDLVITAEMPGIEKKDIKLNARGTQLELGADTESRKYHKVIPLTKEIDPATTKASYNNGVVEIRAKLKEPEKDKGVDIEVE